MVRALPYRALHTEVTGALISLRLVFGDVEALAEALDAPSGVQDALCASVEWMALGAHINTQGALGAANSKGIAAGARHLSGLIGWMDSGFHVA